jgi:Zn-dependent protease
MGTIGIFANIILMVFNLLPLPPLDGGRIATILLPHPWGMYLSRVEPFGFFIIIGLLATGILSAILAPAIGKMTMLIQALVGL